MKQSLAIGLGVAAFSQWSFPNFNGFLFAPGHVSVGEAHIVAAVLFVGALILWFMPNDYENKN